MKSKADLFTKIDDDLAWRKRELSAFRQVFEASHANPTRESTLIRAGIALLYAHWEGFVKKCGTLFIDYVANQGKKGSELQPNFIAIKLKKQIDEAAKSN